MQIKTTVLTALCVLINFQAFALENPTRQAVAKPIAETVARKLISGQVANIPLKNLKGADNINPEQSFMISIDSKIVYIISAHRSTPSDSNLFTCSVLLFDHLGIIKSSFDTMGNDEEKRPWYCDQVEAMSFKDYYPDGSLKIIALYRGTSPSSDFFVLPIIMKFDVNKPSLQIDEELTGMLEGTGVKSIHEVRSLLNNKSGKKHAK